MTNEIKEYVEMGFLYTFWTGEEKKIYSMPRANCLEIMALKNLPKANRPEVIDLTPFGFWFESISMIRGCDKYENTEGEVMQFVAWLSWQKRNSVLQFIKVRQTTNLPISLSVVQNYVKQELA